VNVADGEQDDAEVPFDQGPRATPSLGAVTSGAGDGVTELDISDDADVIVDNSPPLTRTADASRPQKPTSTTRTRKPAVARVKAPAVEPVPVPGPAPRVEHATQAEVDADLQVTAMPAEAVVAHDDPVAADLVAAVDVIQPEPAVPAPPEPLLVESIEAGELKVQSDLDAQQTIAEAEPVVPDASDLPAGELRAVIEAVLLVANRPVTIDRLARCLPGTSVAYLEGFLTGLGARFDRERRGWELRPMANGWQLLTRREHHAWVRQLDRKELPTKLSKSALETLAIVAYQQPVTRGRVEDIRGVQCGPVLRQLMDMRLVAVTGRAEEVLGRPLLYGTSDLFLTRFGLGSLKDLPQKHELSA